MKRFQTTFKTLRSLVTAAVAFLLLLLLALIFVQTPLGRGGMASLLEIILERISGFEVRISGLAGSLPSDVRLDELNLMDRDGVWLSVHDVNLRWSPLELLHGLVRVEQFEAVLMDFMRPPVLPEHGRSDPLSFGSVFAGLRRLTVDEWRVERLSLGEAVLGQKAVFHLSGRMAVREETSGLRTQIRAESWGPPVSKASLEVTARLDERGEPALKLVAHLMEERGGIIGRFMRIGSSGPLHLSLVGDGPLKAWEGRLFAEGAGLGSASASLQFQNEGGGLLKAEGVVDLGTVMEAESLRFACRVRFPDGPSSYLVLEELYLRSPSGSLAAFGVMDLFRDEFLAEVQLRAGEPVASGLVSSLIGLTGRGRIELRGQLIGTLSAPRAKAVLSLTDFSMEPLGASTLEGSFSVEAGPSGSLSVLGEGWILKGTYGGQLLPVLDRVGWAFEAMRPRDGGIVVESLNLWGENARAHISACQSPTNHVWRGEVSVVLTDLKFLGQYVGTTLQGSTEMKAAVTWDTREFSLNAGLKGRWSGIGFPDDLSRVLGDEVGYETALRIRSNGPIFLEDVVLRAKGASVSGGALLSPSKGNLNAHWTLRVHDLEDLFGPLGIPVAGSAIMGGTLVGNLASLRMEAKGNLRGLRIGGQEFPEAFLAVRSPDIWGRPMGRADLTMKGKNGSPLEVSSDLALEGPTLMLRALRAETTKTKVDGDLAFHFDRGLLEGNLAGESEDLSTIGGWIDLTLGGKAKGRMRLEALQGVQMADTELSASELQTAGGAIEQILLRAKVRDPFGNPEGYLELEGRDLERGKGSVRSFLVSATGRLETVAVRARAKGDHPGPFEFVLEGRVEGLPSFSSAVLSHLRGRWGSLPVGLRGEAVLGRQADAFVLERTQWEVGVGVIFVSGSFARDNIDAEASFESTVPQEIWAWVGLPELQGRISGKLRAGGTMAQPVLSVEVKGQTSTEKAKGVKGTRRMTFSASAEAKEGKLEGRVLLKGTAKEEIHSEFSFPLRLSLFPFEVNRDLEGPLMAFLKGRLDLDMLELFVLPEDHVLGGVMELDLSARGSPGEPVLNGAVYLRKGRYESPTTGTILRGMEVFMEGEGRRLFIRNVRAEDGDNGVVQASGWISLEPSQDFPLSLDFRLDDFTLFGHDLGTARAKGYLNVTGSLGNPSVAGALYLTQGELSIPDSFEKEIPVLKVTEINLPERAPVGRPEGPLALPFRIGLNVSVEAPGRLWLRGRGLESEWSGLIKFDGDWLDPIVSGRLSVQRGHFQFFGKRFAFKEGFIQFDGKVPPDPYVQTDAEASSGGITAHLRVSGPSSGLSMVLSSTPPLPVDEILSRVLFGRSKAQITPFQAVTLAHSIVALSGKGSALGIMERLRTTVGLDVLEVKESSRIESGGMSSGLSGVRDIVIGIGKYLTDDVFLKVERGATPGTGRVSVQVEMTPRISLETEVGEDASAGIGINYRLDY